MLENPVGSDVASVVAPGIAPAGGHSLGMGAWGAAKGAIPPEPHHQQMAEWCAVTAGSVTTVDPTGTEHTFTAGDVFLVPKGISYVWKQSEDMKKFYVEIDHAVPEQTPTAIIPYDRAQPCDSEKEYWFFCEVSVCSVSVCGLVGFDQTCLAAVGLHPGEWVVCRGQNRSRQDLQCLSRPLTGTTPQAAGRFLLDCGPARLTKRW
eukprot:COSAG02_NODE_4949_length_4796_cov_12.701512_2_plen_205_part_00